MTKYLSTRQLADMLDVSRQTVYNWVKAGRIPHTALSPSAERGTIRFNPEDIEEWLAGLKRPASGGNQGAEAA